MISIEMQKRWDELWDKLVPSSGPCETLEGETMRAMMKIAYRYYNDGDYFYEGYGCETAGPAHAFLVDVCPIKSQLRLLFDQANHTRKDQYEFLIDRATEAVLRYVESKNEDYTANTHNMLECESHYEDDEDSDVYDDEDEDEDLR